MNIVILLGYVTEDPPIYYGKSKDTQNGSGYRAVSSFILAAKKPRYASKKQQEELNEKSPAENGEDVKFIRRYERIKVLFFGKLAQYIHDFYRRGDMLAVTGELIIIRRKKPMAGWSSEAVVKVTSISDAGLSFSKINRIYNLNAGAEIAKIEKLKRLQEEMAKTTKAQEEAEKNGKNDMEDENAFLEGIDDW